MQWRNRPAAPQASNANLVGGFLRIVRESVGTGKDIPMSGRDADGSELFSLRQSDILPGCTHH
jgi:hypothetical protein